MSKFNWVADTMHSEIGFQIRHLMISNVKGHFTAFESTCVADADFNNAQINFSAQVDSITTNNEQRDGHLKSPDFFDAEKFPTITFKSDDFKSASGQITGNFSMKDVTKKITLDVEFGGIANDLFGQTRAGFTITGKINRKDFGLSWGAITETGNIALADDVKLNIEIQFIKKEEVI